MQLEASSSSVLRVTLEPGDELVESLNRALREHTTALVIGGSGEVEDAELLLLQASGRGRTHRKLAGASDLMSLTAIAGEGGIEIRATVARESETGATVLGGILVKATVISVEIRAIVRGGGASAQPTTPPLRTSTPNVTAPSPPQADPTPPAPVAAAPAPAAKDSSPAAHAPAGPPLPPRLRRAEQPESYPEENDIVTHFAFGRCVVVFSDGERIRFQQERDGRVREVSLSMLRTQDPTIEEDGRRHWDLLRKN